MRVLLTLDGAALILRAPLVAYHLLESFLSSTTRHILKVFTAITMCVLFVIIIGLLPFLPSNQCLQLIISTVWV